MSKKKNKRIHKAKRHFEQPTFENHHLAWIKREWEMGEYTRLLRETAVAQAVMVPEAHHELHKQMPYGIPVPPEDIAYNSLVRVLNAEKGGIIGAESPIESKLAYLRETLPSCDTKDAISNELWIVHNEPKIALPELYIEQSND